MLSKVRAISCHAPLVGGLNYLSVYSKLNVSTDRVEGSCAADINMGPVVGLKNPDKICTFCLLGKREEKLILYNYSHNSTHIWWLIYFSSHIYISLSNSYAHVILKKL